MAYIYLGTGRSVITGSLCISYIPGGHSWLISVKLLNLYMYLICCLLLFVNCLIITFLKPFAEQISTWYILPHKKMMTSIDFYLTRSNMGKYWPRNILEQRFWIKLSNTGFQKTMYNNVIEEEEWATLYQAWTQDLCSTDLVKRVFYP